MASVQKAAKRVLVTGAAGQIAYSLVFLVARGEMLGADQPVVLHLLEVPAALPALNAVCMEVQDCAFPLVHGVVATDDVPTAFKDVDVVLMVGAFPRKDGMERKELLQINAGIFKEHGCAIDKYASRDVKVCVVGNPANTNCYITMTNAPSIPRENFTALTRLDMNRARAQVAGRIGVNVGSVKNVVIWGNHSGTQFPDVAHATVVGYPTESETTSVRDAVKDDEWLRGEFVTTVQQRGAAVIKARKASSAASAAKAIIDHVHDWLIGTAPGEFVSMGVVSDACLYGIERDLIFSYPVTCRAGKWTIVGGLNMSDSFAQQRLAATLEELKQEREAATASGK